MKKKILFLSIILCISFAAVASAYPVSTTWIFNKNYVDVEAYHCTDSQCASVTGPFVSKNTGAAYSTSVNYDVPETCESTHYTAHYFYKECFIPMEFYVWSTCDLSVSNSVNFYKKADCKSSIVSVDIPAEASIGSPVQITANVKSAFKEGVSPPAYVPPSRKDVFYSSEVSVTLTVKKDGATIHTQTKSLNIYREGAQDATFSWTPSEYGTYTAEVVTDVPDCQCSSSLQDKRTFTIAVPCPPADTCTDTDGGNAITVFGTISGLLNGAQYSHSDYCVDSGAINEYYCSGNLEASSQQSCGTDGFVGSSYCLNGNVYRNFKDYFCSNGACSSTTAPVLQQDCSYSCSNGQCTFPPQNTPPVIEGIPDYTVNVGQTIPSIDLFAYAYDAQDADSALSFSLQSQSNTNAISCHITGNRYLDCGPGQSTGFSDIVVKVTDTGGLSDTDTFRVTVQCAQCPPANTPPFISGLADYTLETGQTIPLTDIFIYASDSQDADSALSFYIESQSNPGLISCYITGNRYLGCGSSQGSGYSDITVKVTDTGGLSSTDTFRITVQSQPPPGNHNPMINSLSITPSSPKDSDEQACSVDVSDQDGNLERVQFRWLVQGGLEKTRTIYVSGSSATAQDTMPSSLSGIEDSVECEATVFDTTGRQDSVSDTVTIERQDCGVDVYILEIVDNSKIRFRIRNTAQSSEDIAYRIFVDGGLIEEQTIPLDSNEWQIVQKSYAFGTGEYIVKAKATADCGDTDSETVLHHVEQPLGDERPVIDSIRITPEDPEDFDDLTCRVDVSDQNGDLDRVRFRWLVEGDLEKTRTVDVSGYDDTAQDTLNSGSFSTGDEVECEATVFDNEGNSDSATETATIGGDQDCGVDVFSLQAIGSEIRFEVRNTGNHEQDVEYSIYVENELVKERTIILDSGERRTVQETFYFGSGDDYFVKVKVTADCGSTDWESVYHQSGGDCTAKYLDEYRCSGLWRQRKYQNSDCSTLWLNWESCPQGCYGTTSCSGSIPSGPCSLSIQRFDYQSNVVANTATYVIVEARNTASRQETITFSLYIDNQLKESVSSVVSPNSLATKTFNFYPAAGTHQIFLKVEADCGSSEMRTASFTATQDGVIPSPYVPSTPQSQPSLPTTVSIYPSSTDASFCESKFITIDIHSSREQVFTIAVSGVPSEWVSYQSQNTVEQGDRQLYVYVGPKEVGNHKIRIDVRAVGENLAYSQEVSIYTASCQAQPGADGGLSITGSLIEATQNPLFWILLIVLAAGIIILIGFVKLRPDVEYYEPTYPYRLVAKRDR